MYCICPPQTSGLPVPSQTSQSHPDRFQWSPSRVHADNQITLTPDQINHSPARLEQSINEQQCHLTSPPELTWAIHQRTAVANLDVWTQPDLLLITHDESPVYSLMHHTAAAPVHTCFTCFIPTLKLLLSTVAAVIRVLLGLMLIHFFPPLTVFSSHRMLLGSSGLCLRSLWGRGGRPWPTDCSPSVRWLTSGCGPLPTLSASSPA